MHPFYGPSGRLLAGGGARAGGLISMAAYLAFWAGVVALAYRMANERLPASGRGQNPLDIARTRYASGEIDREQFLILRADLEAAPGPTGGGPR